MPAAAKNEIAISLFSLFQLFPKASSSLLGKNIYYQKKLGKVNCPCYVLPMNIPHNFPSFPGLELNYRKIRTDGDSKKY